MIRLVLIAAFIAILAIVLNAMIGSMRVFANAPDAKDEGMFPGKISRVTYVLLVLLLFGVASGILGAA